MNGRSQVVQGVTEKTPFQRISVYLHRFNSIFCTTVLFQLTAQTDGHSIRLATANL